MAEKICKNLGVVIEISRIGIVLGEEGEIVTGLKTNTHSLADQYILVVYYHV